MARGLCGHAVPCRAAAIDRGCTDSNFTHSSRYGKQVCDLRTATQGAHAVRGLRCFMVAAMAMICFRPFMDRCRPEVPVTGAPPHGVVAAKCAARR